jgi:hypothetical protein
MIFNFFTNDSCGGVAVYVSPTISVPIDDGFFDVEVDVPHGVFHGQGIWLEVEVDATPLGCEALLPTPYALSLKPGATIAGEKNGVSFGDGVVNVDNTAPAFPGSATGLFARSATGSAVRAESDSVGVSAESLWRPALIAQSTNGTAATFQSGGGYGVRVNTDGDDHWDHAGYFTAQWGYGLYVTSTHNMAVRGESGDTSGLTQPVGHVGVVGIGEARGVYGSAGTGAGVTGMSAGDSGVYGETDSTNSNDAGVKGQTWSGTATPMLAVKYGTTGIAFHAINDGTGGSGVWAESTNGYGVYANTGTSDNNYGIYTPDNLYALSYHLMGAIMQVVQNGGDSPLEAGDVVVFSGIDSALTAGGAPVVQVARATKANDTGVAGVVYGGYNIETLLEDERTTATGEVAQPSNEITKEGPIAPGQYLLLVVHGPAEVNLESTVVDLQPGDLLAVGGEPGVAGRAPTVSLAGVETPVPGTVLGKLLEAVDSTKGSAYVFVTLD